MLFTNEAHAKLFRSIVNLPLSINKLNAEAILIVDVAFEFGRVHEMQQL